MLSLDNLWPWTPSHPAVSYALEFEEPSDVGDAINLAGRTCQISRLGMHALREVIHRVPTRLHGPGPLPEPPFLKATSFGPPFAVTYHLPWHQGQQIDLADPGAWPLAPNTFPGQPQTLVITRRGNSAALPEVPRETIDQLLQSGPNSSRQPAHEDPGKRGPSLATAPWSWLSQPAMYSMMDLESFKSRLHYIQMQLDQPDTVVALDRHLQALAEERPKQHRVFYLALPPFLFAKAVENLRERCWSKSGWNRVIVEKPFGKNGTQAAELTDSLKKYLDEKEIFRMDHYLAKTLVLNLLTLRFANRELGHLFHCHHVANVRITFKEAIGVEGRAGYFDGYGIIRDIMQNHLMQVLTLVAMEAPATLEAEDVRDEKVKVLKQIRPIAPRDCVIGQYEGYQNDPDIQEINRKRGYASRSPTFAVAVLYLDNERWSGVPFIMKAGKGLEVHQTIVRIQFKKAPPNSLFGEQPQNELVIRIQPNEAIYYKILAKMPGLTQQARDVEQTVLDLDLKKRFELRRTPEAYEKLIHDVIQGESHNFVRKDELEQAWRIFDPLLTTLEEEEKRVPEPYRLGSRGPLKADMLIDRMGFRRYTVTGVPGFAEDDFD